MDISEAEVRKIFHAAYARAVGRPLSAMNQKDRIAARWRPLRTAGTARADAHGTGQHDEYNAKTERAQAKIKRILAEKDVQVRRMRSDQYILLNRRVEGVISTVSKLRQ